MWANKGFTLIELLVVIAIIGLLASIVLASLSTARSKAGDAALIEDVKSFKTALELYYTDNGGYPTAVDAGYCGSNGDCRFDAPTLKNKLVPKYIGSIPAPLTSNTNNHYYAGTLAVSSFYDMHIFLSDGSHCRSGVVPQYTGDWSDPTVCNF